MVVGRPDFGKANAIGPSPGKEVVPEAVWAVEFIVFAGEEVVSWWDTWEGVGVR